MKLKVYVTKIHSVEVLRNGIIGICCDTIEGTPLKNQVLFLNKRMYKMVKLLSLGPFVVFLCTDKSGSIQLCLFVNFPFFFSFL